MNNNMGKDSHNEKFYYNIFCNLISTFLTTNAKTTNAKNFVPELSSYETIHKWKIQELGAQDNI